MAEASAPHIGRRVREIRVRQGRSLQVVAGLAGLSAGYLSRIERGERPVERRRTLEALASALSVPVTALTRMDGEDATAGPVLEAFRLALADIELGEEVDGPPAPWETLPPRIAATAPARAGSDYISLAGLLPTLIPELHGHVNGPHREEALRGLVDCYLAAQSAVRQLGQPDLASVAAGHIRDVTAALSGPEWAGLAAWARVQAIGSTARERAIRVSAAAATMLADLPAAERQRREVVEMCGMLHLAAALCAVTMGRPDLVDEHVAEASALAAQPGVGGPTAGFGRLHFGVGNVGIWRTLLAVEAGDGPRAVGIARGISPDTLPVSRSRRSAWWIDVGRALAMETRTRAHAVNAFREAEELAPQRFRASTFAREAVVDLLQRARRDAGGRELRSMAMRLGVGSLD